MTNAALTRLAMGVAGVMLAHQVASKAVREATFLSGPGVSWLPAMMMMTSLAVVAAVPAYARLLAVYGPRAIVPIGFAISSFGHLAEWLLPPDGAVAAVVVYFHVAGFGALLLSGFWLLLSEIFDPRTAKNSYGPIASAGTVGGLAGGAAVMAAPLAGSLLLLAMLHAACAALVWWLGARAPQSTLAGASGPAPRLFDREVLGRVPYLRTLALLVTLSTAAASVLDLLFKQGVADWSDSKADLQFFFALFYMGVGLVTFLAQTRAGALFQTIGIGRTISILPAGLGTAALVTFIVPAFPLIVATRAIETALRGSWFRSGYELLFVPMAPDEKRRVKTFLDVTCDRAGDAVGAAMVQVLIVAGAAVSISAAGHARLMLGLVSGLAALGLWLTQRVDRLYFGVVSNRLADQVSEEPVTVQSETGWTLLELPPELKAARRTVAAVPLPAAGPAAPVDPRLRSITELQSGDRYRVETALRNLVRPDRTQIAQVILLLAWDDLAPLARHTLEKVATSHVGLLEDALLDRETDFAIRRRIPRILGNLASDRALDALFAGLDDVRFEVRYQCARAIHRIRAMSSRVPIDRDRVLAIVERELSVPFSVWQGHRLLDAGEPGDEPDWLDPQTGATPRNIEHVFGLLALILPREPLQAALRGIQSADPELRALTLEYLESALPPSIVVRLWALPPPVTPSSGGAP